MKIKKIIRILLIILGSLILIWLLAGSPVEAAEIPWYETKALKVDNPVILDEEEYTEGVTLESNPISDLTFLEVPFEQFLNYDHAQMQVITISEAMYYRESNLESELVLYLYVPDNYIGSGKISLMLEDIEQITTDISLIKQVGLFGDKYLDFLSKYDTTEFNYKWSKVNQYANILKFSYSENTKYSIKDKSLNDILLKEYNSNQNVTEINTTFEIKINSVANNTYTFIVQDSYRDIWITRQEVNFVYKKENQTADDGSNEVIHDLTSIVYDEGTVKVDGKLFRLRFETETSKDLAITGGDSFYGHDSKYTDFFYYFFNVKDDFTGREWDGSQIITGLDYTFYDYQTAYNLHKGLTFIDPFGENFNEVYLDVQVKYYRENGSPLFTDDRHYEFAAYESWEFGFDNIDLREPETLKEIYQKRYLKQETFDFKYPNPGQTMVEWWGGEYDTTITTLPTLFSTTDADFVNTLDYQLLEGVNSTDYQYAFMVGDKGYAASSEYNYFGYPMLFLGKDTLTEYQYGVELISVDWIYYDYLNVSHAVKVSETKVDKSDINNPVNPGESDNQTPLFPEKPGPKEGNPNWFQRVGDFFSNIGEFFKRTKSIWIVLGFVLLGLIILSIIRRFLDWFNTFRISSNLRQQGRIQRMQIQQQSLKSSKTKKSKKRKK